jgi:5-methyltetrahydrofolate--homocysteine methyltransferase
MTHTLVASATREHIIGFDRPFTVIGERINPTGRKKLAAEMQAGNFETVIKDALAQMAAGAHILDVNAGVTAVNPNETEPPLLRQTLEIVQSICDLPLCIDSSVTSALKMGLETAKGRPLVNSVTGEEEKLEAILPLVGSTTSRSSPSRTTRPASRKTRTCASPWPRRSSSAPPTTASSRMTSWSIRWSCRSAPWAGGPAGVPPRPPAARGAQGQHHLRRLQRLLRHAEPPRLTGYFLAMAASHGMTSAIMNPLHDEDMHAIFGANVLNGTDRNCKFWTNKFREMTAAPSAAAQAAGEISSNEEIEARRKAREERRRRSR